MSLIIQSFYNIFWQDPACQNLFLLSKEELLESISFGDENNPYTYSSNRIIISNAQNDSEAIDTIKFRSERYDLFLGNSLEEKIEYFKPIIEDIYDKKLKKSFEKLINDYNEKGWRLFVRFIKIISNEKKREDNIIQFLHDYGFIGKHIKTFEGVEKHFEKLFIPKKRNELINEQTINTFFEGIKFIKELYVNHSYKKLYTTNQVLVNTLYSEDNFNSRLKLFHLLYESKIIYPSNEDAFVECSNCEPETYKGTLQLRINPKKLNNLKCPLCSSELTYFIPYELDKEIHEIVKSKDGLLLNALCNRLDKYNIDYKTNVNFLDDIELDCFFNKNDEIYFIEVKMYKLNTSKSKLKSKVKEHYGKLVKDVKRLIKLDQFNGKRINPILLLNINNDSLLREIIGELKGLHSGTLESNCKIINLGLLRFEE
ncbi:hypothetical protein [uncultured Kordia sp.]|uniref:hypothetical protein n=1 Tax=uncultured Kordia sp. TaxID=507699 RepID=UPI0026128C9E|nr:hypothetical protein [uncultured Kordia sp.]